MKYIGYELSKNGREIYRISKLKRHTLFSTKIYGKPFKFVDSVSFVGQYNEIIKKGIYNFSTDTKSPYIVDCGANVGNSILYFKQKYPNAEIIAFEPDKLVFPILQENINNFSFQNVTLINKGVWSSDGSVCFISKGDDSGKIVKVNHTSIDTEKIEVVRIRAYLNRPVRLLKIDIEGAEYEVLRDISDLLVNVERIFIEYHSSVNEDQNLHLILEILNKAGFRYYLEQTTIFSTNPFIKINHSNGLDNLINIFGYHLHDNE